jgi:hypothetical protein
MPAIVVAESSSCIEACGRLGLRRSMSRTGSVRLHSTIGCLPPVEWEGQHALDHPLASPLAA